MGVFADGAVTAAWCHSDELPLQRNTWQKACTQTHNWCHWLTLQCTVYNHYIRTHALSYHLTGTSKEESREKQRKERKLGRTTQSLHEGSLSAHCENEKQSYREWKPVSLDTEGIHFKVFFQWRVGNCIQLLIMVLPWQQVYSNTASSIFSHRDTTC